MENLIGEYNCKISVELANFILDILLWFWVFDILGALVPHTAYFPTKLLAIDVVYLLVATVGFTNENLPVAGSTV